MNSKNKVSNKIAIQTFNLNKQFGNLKAVQDVNLKIEEGEIFSLLGTNGAGKTTTIKMLSCLLIPTSGSAELLGYDIKNEPDKIKQIIGVSPQETSIAGRMSAKENLLLIGGVFGLKKENIKKRCAELLDLMELKERKSSQARKLSGGMQRRLSIAMALMSDPKILFLDEPTLGLDPHARRSVWNYIEKLKGEKTILLTTHYLDEADELADRIAIMDHAKIIASGTPDELKEQQIEMKRIEIFADHIPEKLAFQLINNNYEVMKTKKGLSVISNNLDFYFISDLLKENNIDLKGLQMLEPSLDEVFIKLTGKEATV